MFEKSAIAVLVPVTLEMERCPARTRAKTETSKGVPKVKGTAKTATRFTGRTTLGPDAADQRGFWKEPTTAPGKEHNALFTTTLAPSLKVATMIEPDPAKPLALIDPLMVTEKVITPACPLSVGCVMVNRSLNPASETDNANEAPFDWVLLATTEITPSRALPEVKDDWLPLVPDATDEAVAAPVKACSLNPVTGPNPTETSAPMSGPPQPQVAVNHADWLKPPGDTVVACFRPATAAEEIEARAMRATVSVRRNMMVTTPRKTGAERSERADATPTSAVHAKTKAPAAILLDVFRWKTSEIARLVVETVGMAAVKPLRSGVKGIESRGKTVAVSPPIGRSPERRVFGMARTTPTAAQTAKTGVTDRITAHRGRRAGPESMAVSVRFGSAA